MNSTDDTTLPKGKTTLAIKLFLGSLYVLLILTLFVASGGNAKKIVNALPFVTHVQPNEILLVQDPVTNEVEVTTDSGLLYVGSNKVTRYREEMRLQFDINLLDKGEKFLDLTGWIDVTVDPNHLLTINSFAKTRGKLEKRFLQGFLLMAMEKAMKDVNKDAFDLQAFGQNVDRNIDHSFLNHIGITLGEISLVHPAVPPGV
jgi:hypothetical protein